MAEEQVASQALILDGNMERLAKKISDIELKLRAQKLNEQKLLFWSLFTQLCYIYYKLTKFDLPKITDDNELLTLESEVFKRADRAFNVMKYVGIPFMILIPIIGWSCLAKMLSNTFIVYNRVHYYDQDFITFRYCRSRRKLIEVYGKEFLSEVLKYAL